jgi:hypothetical protein
MQMKRTRFNVCALSAASLSLMMLAVLAAQSPNQIHPPPPPVERAINIVVLADGFTASQQDDFNEAAANFFNHGLLADSVFSKYKDIFGVKTIFNPVALASTSQFGFVLGVGVTNCSISWDEGANPATNTATLIETAAAAANPTHIVVIGNHPYNFGCANDNWAYVAAGAVGERILQHEFGHLLANLYDEYEVPELANTKFTGVVNELNCSTNQTTPHWTNIGLSSPPALANAEGCALFGKGIIRPYDECVMGAHGNTFCQVCERELGNSLDYFKTQVTSGVLRNERLAQGVSPGIALSTVGLLLQAPSTQQPTPSAPNRVVRLLLNVNRTTGAVNVLTATEVAGRATPRERRLGTSMYEIRDGTQILSVGVLQGDPFRSHGYRGGAAQHSPVPNQPPATDSTASVTVSIPGESRDTLLQQGRQVEVWFYTLSPQVKDTVITTDSFRRLRDSKQVTNFARLDAGRLREALGGKSQRPQAR